MTYWINTVYRHHVLLGKAGSFVQADHGKRRSLDRMKPGVGFCFDRSGEGSQFVIASVSGHVTGLCGYYLQSA
jgi:hypothetical protein